MSVLPTTTWRRAACAAGLLLLAGALQAAPARRAVPVPKLAPVLAHLLAESLVPGETIRLGDVARIDGPGSLSARLAAVEVGPAPLPGHARTMSADSIRIRLRQNHLDPALLASDSQKSCRVTRAFQTITVDQILETARGFLRDKIEAGPGRLALESVSRPQEMVLPSGALDLAASLPGPTVGSIRRVIVKARVDGKDGGEASVMFRVRRYARVAVTTAVVTGGEALGGHVAYEDRDLTEMPGDVYLDGELPDGLYAVRALSPGTPITRSAAAPPPVIHRGDTVMMRAETGGIAVTVPAEALEDGRPGEVIRVRNTNSQREGRARVVDAKTVQAAL